MKMKEKRQRRTLWVFIREWRTAAVWIVASVLATNLAFEHWLFTMPSAPELKVYQYRSQFHEVQPGETISAIAQRFAIAPAAIMQANAITDPAKLAIGTIVRIPVHSIPAKGGKTMEESFSLLVDPSVPSRTMDSLIAYDHEVVINIVAIQGMVNYWREQFGPGGPRHHEFQDAFNAMCTFKDDYMALFANEGAPQELFWLALPESFWRAETSSKGAAGYWQLMPETARSVGLTVARGNDERLVPRACARGAARYLNELYEELGDWSLVLNRYNGGFASRYAAQETIEVSYERFLAFMEKEVHDIQVDIQQAPYTVHTVRAGDTIGKLRTRYGLHKGQVMTLPNGQKPNPRKLQIGDELHVPLLPKQQRALFEKRVAGYIENLEYPAKFVAVLQLVREAYAHSGRTMVAKK